MTFPSNIVTELKTSFETYMPDHTIILRPLRTSDPDLSVGLVLQSWNPDVRSVQMGAQREPVLNRYLFRIQNMVKSGDEELGRELFSVKAKSVRAILYRDAALQVRLLALTETILGSTESFKRYGVGDQRFLNNDLTGTFLFVASTNFWVETETVQL